MTKLNERVYMLTRFILLGEFKRIENVTFAFHRIKGLFTVSHNKKLMIRLLNGLIHKQQH